MKQLLIIALFAAVVLSASLKDTQVSLAQMQKSPFGATILSVVQLNIAAGYDASPIVNIVQEIITQLGDSQQDADQRNTLNKASCVADIAQFHHQIDDTTNTISNLETSIQLNSENLASDTNSLAQANSDYDSTVSSIDNGTADREASNQRWIESDAELADAINAIDEATKLVQHMIHGVSFVQVKVRYEKVLERLSMNKSKHASLFKPLISALSQISNKLNFESVQKIINLLSNLRSALTDSKNEGIAAEESAAQLWATLLSQLLSNKQRYADLKSEYAASISNLTDLLAQQATSLENNKNSLENFTIQLSDEEALCQKQADAYASSSQENSRETEILNELVEHLEENFAALLEFVH